MVTHRIKELRDLRGMSQERLAGLIGRTKSVISRLEDGKTKLDLDTTQKIAEALGVTVADVLGIESGYGVQLAPTGMAEDVAPYEFQQDDRLRTFADANRSLYIVKTDAVSLAGVRRGDVVVMNDSAMAVQGVKPLQVVLVLFHPPGSPNRAVSLLRQYVPPRLLITNSEAMNTASLDISRDDAHIVAVLESLNRRLD